TALPLVPCTVLFSSVMTAPPWASIPISPISSQLRITMEQPPWALTAGPAPAVMLAFSTTRLSLPWHSIGPVCARPPPAAAGGAAPGSPAGAAPGAAPGGGAVLAAGAGAGWTTHPPSRAQADDKHTAATT